MCPDHTMVCCPNRIFCVHQLAVLFGGGVFVVAGCVSVVVMWCGMVWCHVVFGSGITYSLDNVRVGRLTSYPKNIWYMAIFCSCFSDAPIWWYTYCPDFEGFGPPDPVHETTSFCSKQAIKFFRTNHVWTPHRPFFIYFEAGGTHGPHHLRHKWADMYKGKYDMGCLDCEVYDCFMSFFS